MEMGGGAVDAYGEVEPSTRTEGAARRRVQRGGAVDACGDALEASLLGRRPLGAVGALLLAGLATAPQASAGTIYACVKKNGAVRIVTKRARCKRGEKKLSWNSEGVRGKNGTNGKNGANGTNGTNGQDLTSHTPLPSKQSESGFFALGGGGSKAGFVVEGISFSQPLSAPIAPGRVAYNKKGITSPNCPGFGQAAPGFVCLYESEGTAGLSFFIAHDFALNANAADKYGFALLFEVKAALGFVAGSWTVTAP